MSETKTVTVETFESYVAGQPPEAQAMLEELRGIVRSVAPDAAEGFSYGMPVFRHNGTLAWIGGFRNHCSLFGIHGSIMDSFATELDGYRTSKGTIQFQLGKPIPADLVGRLIEAQLERNSSRAVRGGNRNARTQSDR